MKRRTHERARGEPEPGLPARAVAWGARPVSWLWAAVAGCLVLLGPLWLWADPLDGFSPAQEGVSGLAGRLASIGEPLAWSRLFLDDFYFVADSRTPADLRSHLWSPHNSHVIPLFRLWTHGWLRAAGRLESVPSALAVAALLTYGAAMLLVGHVAAWESGRPAFGLAVMAGFGVSSVLEPAVRWYAASQAIAAAVLILAALAALQVWRSRGGAGWLVAATAATLAAPFVWSGGYLAGPAGFAYLWADGRKEARRAAFAPLAATGVAVLAVLAVLSLAGRAILAPANFQNKAVTQAANPIQGAFSTAQGLVEILTLRNLGLAAETTPAQAVALVGLMTAAWVFWRRRTGSFRIARLEAAGGVLAVVGFGLVFTARGYYGFENLRDYAWYRAIPQVGAALFVAGAVLGPEASGEPPRALRRPTRGGLLAVLGVIVVATVLQRPVLRAERLTRVGPLTPAERSRFPIPYLQRLRARYLLNERGRAQRQELARLDRAERLAEGSGLGRDGVRQAVGLVPVPGLPPNVPPLDFARLLALPETGSAAAPASLGNALRTLFVPLPEPRPPWLGPGDPWP